jgi:hypothetical protein
MVENSDNIIKMLDDINFELDPASGKLDKHRERFVKELRFYKRQGIEGRKNTSHINRLKNRYNKLVKEILAKV